MRLLSQVVVSLGIVLTFLFSQIAYALSDLSPVKIPLVRPIGHEIDDFHRMAFYICLAIALLVFAVLLYTLIKFRRSKRVAATNFHKRVSTEIIWTMIPFILFILMIIPATLVLMNIPNEKTSNLCGGVHSPGKADTI